MNPSLTSPASIKLPLAFILTGVIALFAGVGWLVADPSILATYHYNQSVISVTHLLVLGWICSVVMGAMYQLVPVALETKLFSEKLAWWQLACHVIGFFGMVWMFRVWNMKQVGHFGCVLGLGVGLFVYNLVRTLWRVPKWNLTATAVSAALFWLSLTIVAGLCIAAGKCTYSFDIEGATVPTGTVGGLVQGLRSVALFMRRFDAINAMHAHAHLGAVGCFTMLIVGVSYKLVPMFTLSEVRNRRRAALSIALLNLALAGSFVTILIRSPWKFGFALLAAIGLSLYGWELLAIYQTRKRRPLDWGIGYFLTGVSLLLPVSILAIVLSWPALPLNPFTGQLENLYGFLGLLGFISFAIIGMLYKIVPFLVWFGRYSSHLGISKVPALAEMYSSRLQSTGYWTFLAGLTVTSPAILSSSESLVRIGCGLLALSIASFGINIALILSHFAKPRLPHLASSSLPILKSA
jgi:cbb3-type cytochrome oxidase subunit 1